MKRLLSLLMALCLLLGMACAEAPLSDNGEIILNDVTFFGAAPEDNNRVFYEIFVGSFSDANGDGIGDLRGIINRMDYLNDGDPDSGLSLGVEGIWLTPIFTSPSYHKYDVADFYQIDPTFGTMADLQELIDLCHARGVKIILDLPINHTSKENRWFKNFSNAHRMNNTRHAFYDYYTWLDAEDARPAGRHFAQVAGMDLYYEANFSDDMPELNYDNEAVRQAVLDVAKHYIDMGIDGFRFDAAKYIYYGDNAASAEFWQWYLGELRQMNPNLYTVAEVWDGDGIIEQYLPMTSCFNFTASQASGIIAATAKNGNVNAFTKYIDSYLASVEEKSDVALSTLFVANHDTDRAAGYLPASNGRAYVAASLYLLSPGSPFIYYGEEIGLRGSRGGANTDANRRLAMVWGDGDTVADPIGTTYESQTSDSVKDQRAASHSLYTHYKRLLMIRKANPEIARGDYTALEFAGTKLGGFTATWNGSTVAVLHNSTTRTMTVDLAEATDLPFTTIAAVAGLNGCTLEGTLLTLEGQTSVVLR